MVCFLHFPLERCFLALFTNLLLTFNNLCSASGAWFYRVVKGVSFGDGFVYSGKVGILPKYKKYNWLFFSPLVTDYAEYLNLGVKSAVKKMELLY